MADSLTESLSLKRMEKLTHFKEYAVSHPQLTQVDRVLMRAIREPAGFAHVLVYGPSGVGDAPSPETPPKEPTPPKKKSSRRVGQRQPKRDPVG